ncbi:hypothetical protein [Quadrisphaera sp. KR29]|uniref:hypothetical protein n=1 Tax=Quadrisphaera sp. KR29 TaxID=3461391 RepID=UPI004043CA38
MQVVAHVSPEELRSLMPLLRDERLLDIRIDVDAVGDDLELSPIALTALIIQLGLPPGGARSTLRVAAPQGPSHGTTTDIDVIRHEHGVVVVAVRLPLDETFTQISAPEGTSGWVPAPTDDGSPRFEDAVEQEMGALAAAGGILWFTLDTLWGGSPTLRRITQSPLALCCDHTAQLF